MSATARWPALGTSAVVVVTEDAALPAARAAVERELAAIDRACSRFRADSELTALNAAGGRPVQVGPLLAQAIAVALRAARATGGIVDPTLGADLRRAGYDRDFAALAKEAEERATAGDPGEPDQPADAPSPARRAGDWRDVELDAARGVVRLPPGVELDLGATAKALAADRAAHAAHELVAGGVLVSLGGDVAVAGPAPADGWAIRVTDDHAKTEGTSGQTISIETGGLATSGTTVRRWRRGEHAFHHILDPRTRRPAEVVWRTASVAAASCVDANAASTAAVVRGLDAPVWLARGGLPARLTATDGTVVRTAGWPAKRAAA